MAEQKARDFKDTTISRHETVDGDHGRIETRTTTVIHDVESLQQRHRWPGLNSVVVVESTREIGDKVVRETRFYVTSLVLLACLIGPIVRSHWAVENSLHWVLDMIFPDDECRVRSDHAPANFTTIKHMALNLIRRAPGKQSMRLRRKAAATSKHGKNCLGALSRCVSHGLSGNTTAETTWDQQLGSASPSRDRNMSRLAICAIFKNEAAFLLEWIAYHRVVGFDHFYLYDNDSTDGGTDLIRQSSLARHVTVTQWPPRPGQLSAYRHFINHHAQACDWVAFIDLDEFLLPLQERSVRSLLDRIPSASAMLVQWRVFGPSGWERRPEGFVIDNYTMRGQSRQRYVTRHRISVAPCEALRPPML